MMRIAVLIKGDGAAFEDAPASEGARLLRDVAERLACGELPVDKPRKLYDTNGNACGWVQVTFPTEGK